MTSNTAGLGPLTKLLPVTSTFALPLVAFNSALSLNVVKKRVELNTFEGDKAFGESQKVKQPDGNEYDPILIATRVHANLAENMPLTLLLVAFAELNGADRKRLSTILATFSVLRVLHSIGLNQSNQLARAIGEFCGHIGGKVDELEN